MSNKGTKSKPLFHSRMTSYRARLRASGLRPVQIWLPDTRSVDFARQCAKQAAAIAAGGNAEEELQALVDAVSDWPDA